MELSLAFESGQRPAGLDFTHNLPAGYHPVRMIQKANFKRIRERIK
jgi:hypothetical protein